MQRSKYIKRILKAILFIALLVIFTKVLDAAFTLDENSTENMLTSYSRTEEIDTVFIGNSVGEMMDTDMYSTLTGTHAFNMCTPSQSMEISYRNLSMAASHHEIKNAVILMSLDMVNADDYSGIEQLYDRVVDSSSPWHERILISLKRKYQKSIDPDIFNTEESINVFIPWQNETAHGFKNITDNLTRRFNRLIHNEPLGKDIAFDLNSIRYGRISGDLYKDEEALLEDDIKEASMLDIPTGMLSPGNLMRLAKICKFCSSNGIDLKVIVTPHRTDYYERYAAFREYSVIADEYLSDFISKRGQMYYNTEDDPDLHEILPDAFFYDKEHIESKYFDKSTLYLYNIMNKMQQ